MDQDANFLPQQAAKDLRLAGQARASDAIGLAPHEDRGLLGDNLRKSFPLESGGTLPGNVVQLMLILAHIERPSGPGEADAHKRNGKRTLLRIAAATLALAAGLLGSRSSVRRSL